MEIPNTSQRTAQALLSPRQLLSLGWPVGVRLLTLVLALSAAQHGVIAASGRPWRPSATRITSGRSTGVGQVSSSLGNADADSPSKGSRHADSPSPNSHSADGPNANNKADRDLEATPLSVDESSAKVTLSTDPPSFSIRVRNEGQEVSARVSVQILDEDDAVSSSNAVQVTIGPGGALCVVPLPGLTISRSSDAGDVLWRRVRYEVEPAGSGPGSLIGILSLSEIAPELFNLAIFGVDVVTPGRGFMVKVQAFHPITHAPQKGVAISARFVADADETTPEPRPAATTDELGYATLSMTAPSKVAGGKTYLKVFGRRGAQLSTVEREISVYESVLLFVSADKPIYQPGQKLHARVMVLNAMKRPLAGVTVSLSVTDPDQHEEMWVQMKTSEYGIASCDWAIPDDQRTGEYTLRAVRETEDGTSNDISRPAQVRISRYQLPHFSVSVSPDRGYYLPGQSARVAVSASYLFGKPVPSGTVKVVREESREWNYREQKWETTEGDTYEGAAGADGTFIANVNLSAEFDDFSPDWYRQFDDIAYQAYFTDSSTGVTEQKLFYLRITEKPIHIYLIEPHQVDRSGHPLTFFVSTSYADGQPAESDVAISLCTSRDQSDCDGSAAQLKSLATTRTNSKGLARVVLAVPTGPDVRDFALAVTAKDAHGLAVNLVREIWPNSSDLIHIEARKAIGRPGEPIVVDLQAPDTVATALVCAYAENSWQLLDVKEVRFAGGRCTAVFDYRDGFKGILVIGVNATASDGTKVLESTAVVYPAPAWLDVNARFDKAEYRPGDEVSARLRVSPAANAALGISVIDSAVEERARTDAEFGGDPWRANDPSTYDAARAVRPRADQAEGMTLSDIETLDVSKPVSEDAEMAADVLLSGYWVWDEEDAQTDENNLRKLFASLFDRDIEEVRRALVFNYVDAWHYPTDERGLRKMLGQWGLDLSALRDPWGSPYIPRFSIEGKEIVLRIMSAGPDKRFDTGDDIEVLRQGWRYFDRIGFVIDRAVARYHSGTGKMLRDKASLAQQLKRVRIEFNSLRDPWGEPYAVRFEVQRERGVLSVLSAGPNRKFETAGEPGSDDLVVWTNSLDYFDLTRRKIQNALDSQSRARVSIPTTAAEFAAFLKSTNIRPAEMRDPWGRPYDVLFWEKSRYADRVSIENLARYGEAPYEHVKITPATDRVLLIELRSAGSDGIPNTADDFTVAQFATVIDEHEAADQTPRPVRGVSFSSTAVGAISGTVTDPTGAVVSRVSVKAVDNVTGKEVTTVSGDDGQFLMTRLPCGFYTVLFEAPGFMTAKFLDVAVSAQTITELDVHLSISTKGEECTVTGVSEALETASMESTVVVNQRALGDQPLLLTQTPRLRKDFPESLFWAPEIHTDASGGATVDFKLADNITTWKMSVVASTKDGRIAFLDAPIKAFQPFFIDHDPPPFLTAGDQIALPVVVRNFTEQMQPVDLRIRPESWFVLKSPAATKVVISPGGYGRTEFTFQALRPIVEGRQRLTAIGADQSDAVEKEVTVNPDGQQFVSTMGQVFNRSTIFRFQLPRDVLPGTPGLKLRVYPNLMSHVLESVEAIMQRPYGCGEQTISSTYPSLMVLKIVGDNPEDPRPIVQKARSYLLTGYRRLLRYQGSDGGFSYWGRGDGNVALTAYAVRFLTDAASLIDVDRRAISSARKWLEKQQAKNGRWPAIAWNGREDTLRTVSTTAYIAMTLSRIDRTAQLANIKKGDASSVPLNGVPGGGAASRKDPKGLERTSDNGKAGEGKALDTAMKYLSRETEQMDEPYGIAAYALAAFDRGDAAEGQRAVARLASLAHREADTTYWELLANTPFMDGDCPEG